MSHNGSDIAAPAMAIAYHSGFGHTAVPPVVAALREIGYAGYLSAEILPLPDSATAARQTIASFRRAVG